MTDIIWIDTSEFRDYGGWTLDTQFTHHIGSPCLMAVGIGDPVADARHELEIPADGRYRLWVLARNWLKEYTPGTFTVGVRFFRTQVELSSGKVFGAAGSDEWVWEDAGLFDLSRGRLLLSLHDLTGYYGRCAILLLTTDLDYRPPAGADAILAERLRVKGIPPEPAPQPHHDLVVAGAGIAGVCAAIAAARHGLSVALLQDRPMVGGNASSECGVSVNGAAIRFDNAREGGIVEEIAREQAVLNTTESTTACERLLARERNISVFTNQRVIGVNMPTPKRIAALRTINPVTALPAVYPADLFVDATGDGWVGSFAGAEYMFGREARGDFGESVAVEKADRRTMSGCIMGNTTSFRAEPTGCEVPYAPPPWAPRFPAEEEFGRYVGRVEQGEWWMEHAGTIDDMAEPERARDELIRISHGYWDYVKNVWSGRERARNWRLTRMPYVNARREGRRLVGDYVLTQNDVQSSSRFPDRISYGGWPVDLHHPEGIFSGTAGPFYYNGRAEDYTIPYRCLYSKNIENLFLSGRAVSVTHVALGTVRVMGTLGTLGQAAGVAAALCKRHGVSPRGVYTDYIAELQQCLLRDDQYIPNVVNEDPGDLARAARVSAASTASSARLTRAEALRSHRDMAPGRYAILLGTRAAGKRVSSVSIFCSSAVETELVIDAHPLDGKPETLSEPSVTRRVPVPVRHAGFVTCPLGVEPGRAGLALVVQPAEGLVLAHGEINVPGVRYAAVADDGALSGARGRPAFYLDPLIEWPMDYAPENVIDGVSRQAGDKSHAWVSDPESSLPQDLTLEFDGPVTFNTVQFTFDTDMNAPRLGHGHIRGGPDRCIRDYVVEARVKGTWQELLSEPGNYQRRRVHCFSPVTADALRLVAIATHGGACARVFEVRVYNEGDSGYAGGTVRETGR
ncbi:MAG: FAD-dependent oxidoreductase [Kiritimatiellia bacterium]